MTLTVLLGISVCCICILLQTCFAYTIPQCGPDGKFEISDTTAEVTIRCTGTGDDPVYMSISRSDGTPKTITSCSAELCHSDSDFKVTREDNAIHVVKKGNVQSRDTLAGTLKCGRQGPASPAASCRLRVVYDAENVENCITEVNEDWTVSGSCQVNKMFASDGHYSCSWKRRHIPQTERPSEFSGQMEVTSTFTENGKTYHRGLCSFAGQPMPTAGRYEYTAKIDPGTVYFSGAVIDIKPPEGDPYMSKCPTQLVEGDTLNCTCHVSSSNPGIPPVIVSWYPPHNMIASSLVIDSVTRSQDGRVFTCRQYWGGYNTSIGQERNYTLHVNYPPPSPPVITGLGTTFTAGDSLSLTCIVSGGKPGVSSVIFYCGSHSDNPDQRQKLGGEEIVLSSLKIQSLTAHDNNTWCYCSASWDTRPGLYRKPARGVIIISAPGGTVLPASTTEVTTEKAMSPTSDNSSDNNDSDDSDDTELAMMVGVTGAVGGIAAVVIITLIIVIFVLKRKYNPPQNRPCPDQNISTGPDHYELVDDPDPVARPHQSLELQPLPPQSSAIQQDQYVNATSSRPVQQSSPSGADYANTEGNQAQPASRYYENISAK